MIRAARSLSRISTRNASINLTSTKQNATIQLKQEDSQSAAIDYAITPWRDLLDEENQIHNPNHSLGIEIVGTVIQKLVKTEQGYFFEVESKAPTDDDLAESGIPSSGMFKVYLLQQCIDTLQATSVRPAQVISIGQMIKITGTIKVFPCDKNEYAYTLNIYATNIKSQKGFGSIVEQRTPITNIARERETQRRRDAVIKEREEQRIERERIETMEAERAEQHAKRQRAERQRKVKDKMKKMGGKSTFGGAQEEYTVELRGQPRVREVERNMEVGDLSGAPKGNINKRPNRGDNNQNSEKTQEEWDEMKRSITEKYEEQFKSQNCIEIRLYGPATKSLKGTMDYKRFQELFKEKYPCDEYKQNDNFVNFLNFEKSFLIKFDNNASVSAIEQFVASLPDKDKVEIADGVMGNVVRTNAE